MDRSKYPPEWEAISLRVRAAAGWACEWCGAKQGEERVGVKGRAYKIVLTVAHVGENRHDKHDCSSLVALCQPCHLRYDHADHVANAKATRERKKRESQPVLSL